MQKPAFKMLRWFSSRAFFIVISSLLFAISTILCFSIKHYKNKDNFLVRIAIDENKLQQKLHSPAPEWMIRQITDDLKPFQETGITSRMVDALFQGDRVEHFQLARFTIRKGHLVYSIDDKSIDNRLFRHTLAAVKKLHKTLPLPDVDFVISLHDGFAGNPNFPFCPCFTFSKTKGTKPFVLIPDFKALTGYPGLREMIHHANHKYPWEKKIPQVFWRGASTGGFLTASNWDLIPRSQLVLLSLKYPQKIDARFTGVVQCTPEVPSILKARKMLSKRVSQKDHVKYKYLIDVDGNACTFERLFWLLLSNSVVFKQTSSYIQWYYEGLEPYLHYIPVKNDLSDLPDQIQWAVEHEEDAKKIAESSMEFVRNNLAIEDVYLYLYHLLTSYAKLQQ